MRKQNGFSMIEVLVTIVIVSIGLLGIAGIIVNSFKSSHSSYARTQATLLANDIIERMRANRVPAEGTNPSPYNHNADLNEAVPDANDTVPQQDLRQWRNALQYALPSGTGSVTMNNTSKNVTIVVQWNNARVEGGSETQQVAIQTRL